MPPDSMATNRRDSFEAVLAAYSTPPALLDNSDGTAQRESFRLYLTLTVRPIAKVLDRELSAKLETDVKLSFDSLYAHDLAGRAMAFSKLVQGGMDIAKAAVLAGLMEGEA